MQRPQFYEPSTTYEVLRERFHDQVSTMKTMEIISNLSFSVRHSNVEIYHARMVEQQSYIVQRNDRHNTTMHLLIFDNRIAKRVRNCRRN